MYQDPRTLQKKELSNVDVEISSQLSANLEANEFTFGTTLALFHQHKLIYMNMMNDLVNMVKPVVIEMCEKGEYEKAVNYCYFHLPDCSGRAMLINSIYDREEKTVS